MQWFQKGFAGMGILVLAGCASTSAKISRQDPFEAQLLGLEQQALNKRIPQVLAEQEARLARLPDYYLPQPDLQATPDVITPVSSEVMTSRRQAGPIGRVSN
ncbi:hypothetical protein DB345_04220 [Spartobacteria bacterium LR76]|nr:hypothetical protein DB345_04220 [Spartobacteria bacterium LR76]